METNSIFSEYVLGRVDEYDTSKMNCWPFRKATDIIHGVECRFSNMAGGFPFKYCGRTWNCSEVLYLCGEFSNDTELHREIQERLLKEKSGFAAKKFIKNPNKPNIRPDFDDFHLQWMLFVLWKKCQGSTAFRNRLLMVPDGVMLIEDTTGLGGATSEIWGAKNPELRKLRKSLQPKIEADIIAPTKKELEERVNIQLNQIIKGTFRGQNNMGKILMMCRTAIKNGVEPPIDYDLLEKHNIYLLGERLSFHKD